MMGSRPQKITDTTDKYKPLCLLWELIRFCLPEFALASTSPFLIQGMIVLTGLLQQAFFNHLQTGTRTGHIQLEVIIWALLAGYLAAGFTSQAGMATTHIFYWLNSFSFATLLQYNLLERILQRPGARAVPSSTGAAISNFRDDSQMIFDLAWAFVTTFSQVVFSIVAFVILLRVNMLITLLVFLPLVGIVVISEVLKVRAGSYRKASRKATSELTGAISEFFNAVQAIQVAGAERRVVEHFEKLNDQRLEIVVKEAVLITVTNTLFYGASTISTGLILTIAALTVRSNPLHAGDLVLFTTYLGTITGLVQSIGRVRLKFEQTNVSFERLVKLLQGAPPKQLVAHKQLYLRGKGPPALVYPSRLPEQRLEMLEVRALSYHFPDTKRGIKGIDLFLPQGSLTVITGRIGSGKTTLLQVLLGLLPLDSGEIYWNGQQISDPASFFTPPRSAYTPQTPHLFSDPLKENILLGLPESAVDLPGVVHMAVMDHDVETLEKGLETLIGNRGVKLSGGQAQRTAAARMLVRDAELLVFDDLSSTLDVETERVLWERLFASNKGHTYLTVSHRRTVLEHADHIIVLKNGQVEAQGSLATLLETCEEMLCLWHGDWNVKEEAGED